MKLLKLSLIAAIAATTAIAGEAKIGGDVKLFYGTNDAGDNSLFSRNGGAKTAANPVGLNGPGSIGDVAVSLDYSRKVTDGVTLNLGVTGVSTLGLENEIVSNTWIAHSNHGTDLANAANDVVWLDTANIVLNVAKTTAVIGRQELDTPFFRSEKWNIAANTFDAAVLVNQDIEDTTLVGAWVGRGNGTTGSTVQLNNQHFQGGIQPIHSANGGAPAYAAGVITKAIPMTTLQLWAYKIPSVATAQWVQADITATDEVSVGLQYAGTKLTASGDTTSAVAAKVGYAAGPISVSGAYSKRDDKVGIDISNIATGHNGAGGRGSESNLYTEAYWNYGMVGAQGAQAFKLAAGYDLGAAQLGASFLKSDATTTATNVNNDLTETTLTVATKVGPINAELAYVNADVGTVGTTTVKSNSVFVMLTAPFSL